MKQSRKRVLAALAVSVAVGSAAGFVLATQDSGTPGGDVVIASGSDRLPSETAVDWVSYADHVAIVEVTAEAQIPPSPEELEVGEGYIGRSATLEIQKILWSRDNAPQAPTEITPQVAGWVFGEDSGPEGTPMALHGTSRLETGHTYIVALGLLTDGWTPIGSGAVLPYDNNTIGQGEVEGDIQTLQEARATSTEAPLNPPTIEQQLTGQNDTAITTLLNDTPPDPAAAPHMNLDPEKRWARVIESLPQEPPTRD